MLLSLLHPSRWVLSLVFPPLSRSLFHFFLLPASLHLCLALPLSRAPSLCPPWGSFLIFLDSVLTPCYILRFSDLKLARIHKSGRIATLNFLHLGYFTKYNIFKYNIYIYIFSIIFSSIDLAANFIFLCSLIVLRSVHVSYFHQLFFCWKEIGVASLLSYCESHRFKMAEKVPVKQNVPCTYL